MKGPVLQRMMQMLKRRPQTIKEQSIPYEQDRMVISPTEHPDEWPFVGRPMLRHRLRQFMPNQQRWM